MLVRVVLEVVMVMMKAVREWKLHVVQFCYSNNSHISVPYERHLALAHLLVSVCVSAAEAPTHMSFHTGSQAGEMDLIWNIPLSWQRECKSWQKLRMPLKTSVEMRCMSLLLTSCGQGQCQ